MHSRHCEFGDSLVDECSIAEPDHWSQRREAPRGCRESRVVLSRRPGVAQFRRSAPTALLSGRDVARESRELTQIFPYGPGRLRQGSDVK